MATHRSIRFRGPTSRLSTFHLHQQRATLGSRRRPGAATNAAQVYLDLVQSEQARLFVDFLLKENTKYNLTAVRDHEDAHERHVQDSLSLLQAIDLHSKDIDPQAYRTLLDVGSGPGLPGCVLAIARPEWEVTCLDSMQKRCAFVRQAAQEAGIANVSARAGRCEDLAREQGLREAFDVVTARAVAEARVLAEFCLPFVAVGGLWVAAKGPNIEDEVDDSLNAIKELGGEVIAVHRVESFSQQGQRTALIVRKVTATPPCYPRATGVPKKKPL